MKIEEAEHWLREIGKPCVRVNRRQEAGYGHFGVARMLSLSGQSAMVQPFGHGHDELVELEKIHIWTSKIPPGTKMYQPTIVDRFAPMKPLTQKLGDLIIKKDELKMQNNTNSKWKPGDRKYTDAQYNEARKLRQLNKTWPEISVITGVPKPALYAMLSKEFAVPGYSKIPAERWAAAKDLFNKGTKLQVISNETGIRYQTLWTKSREWQREAVPANPVKVAEVYRAPAAVLAPIKAETQVVKMENIKVEVQKAKHTIYTAIRGILQLPIPDTSKLLAIEGLVSHE